MMMIADGMKTIEQNEENKAAIIMKKKKSAKSSFSLNDAIREDI
jgi:hypothetical protein